MGCRILFPKPKDQIQEINGTAVLTKNAYDTCTTSGTTSGTIYMVRVDFKADRRKYAYRKLNELFGILEG